MKQVTMESVKQRITDLQHADDVFGLGLCSEFELACLRELVAVTEQRDAVVAKSVELKSKGRELLDEACKVYEAFNASIDPESGDFIDGQTLHEFQFVLDTGSGNACAILDSLRAEAKAEVLDEMAATYRDCANEDDCSCNMKSSYNLTAERAENYAAYVRRQLRESKGANHE